jgi:tripartite-type tricarboxylate transporter receptor subunit TctC
MNAGRSLHTIALLAAISCPLPLAAQAYPDKSIRMIVAGVKPEIIERLSTEIVKVLNTSEIKSTFAKVGVDAAPTTPAEFSQFVRAEMDKWSRVIKDARIQVN